MLKLLKSVIIIISALGFVYTTLVSVKDYVSYETITQSVKVNEPDTFKMPNIIFMIGFQERFVSNRSGENVWKKISEETPRSLIEKSVKLSDIIREFSYMSMDYEMISFKNSTEFDYFMNHHVTTYIFDTFIHFNIHLPHTEYAYEKFYRNEFSLKYFEAPKTNEEPPYYFEDSRNIFQTTIEPEYSGKVFIFISSTPTALYNETHLPSEGLLSTVRGAINLSMFKFKRLPYPYTSNCKNYDDEDLFTKSGCYLRCVNDYYLKSYNKSSPHYVTTRDSKFKVAFDLMNANETFKMSCSEKCFQPECEEIYFKPSAVTIHDHATIPYLKWEILEVHFPKITLVELLINIFGNTSFWFGLSFLTLLNHLHDRVESVCCS